MPHHGRLITGISILLALALPATVLAAAGDRDSTYGGDGVATIPHGADDSATSGVVVGTKIVVAGRSYSNPTNDFLVARFESDGDPDPTFGGGDGIVTTDLGGVSSEGVDAVTALPDGRPLAVGTYYDGAGWVGAIARYKTNGDPDDTFGGGDGVFTGKFGQGYGVSFYDVALLESGKFYVTGEAYPNNETCDLALWRFRANGTPDPSFSGDGMAKFRVGSDCDGGWRLLPLANGDVLVGGWSEVDEGDFDILLARFNSNGTIDTGFGWSGAVTYNPTESTGEWVAGLAVANNKIFVGLAGAKRGTADFGMMRLKLNGGLDRTFGGGDGEVLFDLGADEEAHDMVLDASGKLVFAGSRDSDGFAARVTPAGVLDTTFNGTGFNTTAVPASVEGVAIQANGRIVVIGTETATKDVLTARFLP